MYFTVRGDWSQFSLLRRSFKRHSIILLKQLQNVRGVSSKFLHNAYCYSSRLEILSPYWPSLRNTFVQALRTIWNTIRNIRDVLITHNENTVEVAFKMNLEEGDQIEMEKMENLTDWEVIIEDTKKEQRNRQWSFERDVKEVKLYSSELSSKWKKIWGRYLGRKNISSNKSCRCLVQCFSFTCKENVKHCEELFMLCFGVE